MERTMLFLSYLREMGRKRNSPWAGSTGIVAVLRVFKQELSHLYRSEGTLREREFQRIATFRKLCETINANRFCRMRDLIMKLYLVRLKIVNTSTEV